MSARPAPVDNGHGATGSGKTQWDEGGEETPRSAREERDPVDGDMEERGPPERSRAPNASGRREKNSLPHCCLLSFLELSKMRLIT